MDVPVRIKLDGEAEVKAGLGRLRSEWDLQAKAIGTMVGALGATAVLAKTVGFLKDAHHAAQEYRTSTTLLTTQLGYYSDALIKQADVLGKKLFIDEGDILVADQRLLMYTREENAIKTLIPGIIDLAKIKGIDLVSATTAVGVALKKSTESAEGQKVSIKGLGVTFKATGTEAGNVVEIEKELKKAVGGSAQAVADSLDGWSKLSYYTKQVTDNVGKMLFGVSGAEKKQRIYTQALKEEGETLKYLAGLRSGGGSDFAIKLAKKRLDAEQKIIYAYESEQKELKKVADEKAKAAAEADAEERAEQARIDAKKKGEEDAKKDAAESRSAEKKAFEVFQDDMYKDAEVSWNNQQKLLEDKRQAEQLSSDIAISNIGDKLDAEDAAWMQESGILDNKKKYTQDEKVAAASATANQLGQMARILQGHKQFIGVYKTMAVAQATMDTYASAISAYNSAVKTPIVGPILGPVAAGVAIAFGLENVAKIATMKMAYGGIAAGGIAGQDSIPAMLMPGEIVYNPAHPNPALAAMITNNSTTSNNGHTYHIGSPQITINGNASSSTVAQIREVSETAVLNAIRRAQNMGKFSASGLTIRG